MKVRVQFYAQLRELIGVHELEVELQQGANVRQLLEKIYAQKPALRAHVHRCREGVFVVTDG